MEKLVDETGDVSREISNPAEGSRNDDWEAEKGRSTGPRSNDVDVQLPVVDHRSTINSVDETGLEAAKDESAGANVSAEDSSGNANRSAPPQQTKSDAFNDGSGEPDGQSESPHLPPKSAQPEGIGRPPLPKRPPHRQNRRQRSHSMDNADLAGLRSSGGDASFPIDEFGDTPLIPSSASAGILEGSESLAHLGSDGDTPHANIPPELFDALNNPNFEDDTPAAAALRANANVHVSNVSKFARRIKAQNIRRFVKRAALIGKSGHVRGKPPRAPPFRGADNDIFGGSMPNMYAVEEEDDGHEYMDSSIDSEKEPSRGESAGSPEPQNDIEYRKTAPAAMQHPRSPSDVWRDNDQLDSDRDVQAAVEKDKAVNVRVGIPAHSGAADGIPMEVHTSPEGTGRAKLQIGPHFMAWKRRKAKRKKQSRKSYVKGKVIDGQHELYTLSIAVMLGLRTSIGMTNKQLDDSTGNRKYVESADFRHTEKYVFSPKGGPRTPPHQLSHTFKFKDYSPLVFAYLRRMFGINEFDFLLSVCGNANFIEFISNAKSGQFFFYSYDGKYMIKTMTNAESKFLRRILPHYFHHCAENPNTLITKFLGMYRVKLYHLRRNVKFVIMNSVFDTEKVIKSLYDLKGSTTGRDAKPHQDVKKDNDFRRGRPDSIIALRPEVRTRIREQLVLDCNFFKKMKIMDYSMLVGVHYMPPRQKYTGDTGRLSFRDSKRDTPGKVGSRKRSSQRYLPTEDQKRSSSTENSMPSDKALQAQGKDQESIRRVSGSATQKPPLLPRKPSLAARESVASISTEAGILGDASFSSLHTLEYVFDDDDDNSYLDFANVSSTKPTPDAAVMASVTAPTRYHVTKDTNPSVLPAQLAFPFPGCHEEGDSLSTKLEDIEMKKELTTQQMFWPFHRFYDIHGRRRMVPHRCPQCEGVDCSCGGDGKVYDEWGVAQFTPPLSNRKDGGWMMDVDGADTPFKVKLPNGNMLMCEGKIFYMGIIDILQRFNSRKRAEAVLRRYQGSGWQDASCVHPDLYADRFVAFFDECTQRGTPATKEVVSSSLPSQGSSQVKAREDAGDKLHHAGKKVETPE